MKIKKLKMNVSRTNREENQSAHRNLIKIKEIVDKNIDR